MRLSLDHAAHIILGLKNDGNFLLLSQVDDFRYSVACVDSLSIRDDQDFDFSFASTQSQLDRIDTIKVLKLRGESGEEAERGESRKGTH